MIQAIGIDSTEINRFAHWHTYQHKTLLKIFLPHEITYCLSNPTKSAERFAVRFAAKEAFFKAFSPLIPSESAITLLTICKKVSVIHTDQKIPKLDVAWTDLWAQLAISPQFLIAHISLTHTRTTATALIILEELKNPKKH